MPEEEAMSVAVMAPMEPAKSSKPIIVLPGGYIPEDGKQPGDKVQALVEFTLSDKPGEAYLDSVDGAKYSESEAPEEEVVEEVEEETVEQPAKPMSFKDKAMAMNY